MGVSTIITSPSIGQVEYLRGLQDAAPDALPAYVVVEIETDELDYYAMQKTIAFFIRRHESIRTVFPLIDGEVKQLVLPDDHEGFGIELVDLSHSQQSFEEVRDERFKKAAAGFLDIQKGPLVKFFLFKKAADSFSFFLLIHHIICDNWSKDLIGNELRAFYQSYVFGKEPDAAPLKVQLRDYCEQKNAWLRANKERSGLFWKERLAGFDQLFPVGGFYEGFLARGHNKYLPGIGEKSLLTQQELLEVYKHPEAFKYKTVVSGELFGKIKKLAAINKCSVSAVVYASLYLLLYSYTGKNKLLLAALIADRLTPGHQTVIGCLLGGFYFPRELSGDLVIRDVITKTHRELYANLDHIILSHELLELDGPRLTVSCDIYINYIHRRNSLSQLVYVDGVHTEIPGIYYPLDCMIFEYNDGFIFEWKYNKVLLDAAVIEDMTRCHAEVLDYMADSHEKTVDTLCRFLVPVKNIPEPQL